MQVLKMLVLDHADAKQFSGNVCMGMYFYKLIVGVSESRLQFYYKYKLSHSNGEKGMMPL